jgi:PTS system mannose-specific IIC component
MLFMQALLVGIFCYLGGVDGVLADGVTFGFYIIGRPLVAGLICGIIFGDIQAGVLCGLAVQGVFIAAMHTGGTSSTEITYAAYGGIGLAMATTKDPAIATTLSILIGQTFGLIFYNLRMAGFSYFNRKAEIACENLDKHGLFMNQILIPQVVTAIVRIIPIWAAIYFGQGAVEALINSMPAIVTTVISVLGGVLPALGIAMLMNMLIKEKISIVLFLFGYVLSAFAGLSTLGVLFIAMAVAYVIFLCQGTQSVEQSPNSKIVESDGVYEDADIFN